MTYGQIAYEAGRAGPNWVVLSEATKAYWEIVACAVIKHIAEHGLPAGDVDKPCWEKNLCQV